MKVALCISGQPRYALERYTHIYKHIIEPNSADVFIHMHYDDNALYIEKSHSDNKNCNLKKGIDKELIELYNPKMFLIEPPRNFKNPNLHFPNSRLERAKNMNKHKNWTDEEHMNYGIKQCISMFYSIYKCNELKEIYANENGFVYDYVIRIRFDLMPQEPIICKELNPNYIHYLEMNQPDNMISDWINIGSNLIMNVYSSIYLNIEYLNTFQYYNKSERFENTNDPNSEYGDFSEYMIRDIMHLYKIPKKSLNLRYEL